MPIFQRKQPENAKKKLTVIKERCPQNHSCPAKRVCPAGALVQEGFAAPEVKHDICIVCGKCVKVCPTGALSLIS